MSGTYLITAYRDKDQVKALGARWDPVRRQWFVPPGRDLQPFSTWLPAGVTAAAGLPGDPLPLPQATAVATEIVALRTSEPSASLYPPHRAQTLSQLLAGVAAAVHERFPEGSWTTVELVDTRVRNGHVFLEVSERDAQGTLVARAAAVIWASAAFRILPAFEQATGAQLGPGIKLLVRARPVFRPQHGFTLEIDAIDADYTLGDLEARKREIRERLLREGLFGRNRDLPRPWDYRHVLVIAPEGAAGLGDFQAEAARLQAAGVCQFLYAFSRFQGEGAAREIVAALQVSLEQIRLNHPWEPDAVVIIRGGGAVNDLAWLNDYALARAVCELPIPVLTGIGHERDQTVLDEVAAIRFDTPSKVIAGIEQTIVTRAREARMHFDHVQEQVRLGLARVQEHLAFHWQAVQLGALGQLSLARQRTAGMVTEVRLQARFQLRAAADASARAHHDVRQLTRQFLHQARRDVPALRQEVLAGARRAVQVAATGLSQQQAEVRVLSRQSLSQARQASAALLREIAGQGPEKTLGRGFALVLSPAGEAVTSARTPARHVIIRFRDGERAAQMESPPASP